MDRSPDDTTAGWWRYELAVPRHDREAVSASLWAAGATGVWDRPDALVAWFATDRAPVPAGGRWTREAERDWQAEWKATIAPVRAGRFLIVPSWLADTTPVAVEDTAIELDPGQAFGSGHHATTTLCLELLDELDLVGRTVADVGCGTGVLAIAAARRGASACAVDIDPDAVTVARANAAANDVTLITAVGSVEALPGPADVVVANLVTEVVVTLAPQLVSAAVTTLIVSGIATARGPRARAALEAAGAEVVEVRERDGWLAMSARPDPSVPTDPSARSDPSPGTDPSAGPGTGRDGPGPGGRG